MELTSQGEANCSRSYTSYYCRNAQSEGAYCQEDRGLEGARLQSVQELRRGSTVESSD